MKILRVLVCFIFCFLTHAEAMIPRLYSASSCILHRSVFHATVQKIAFRGMANFVTQEGYVISIHNDPDKKYGNFLRVQCPKDGDYFSYFAHLSKPHNTYQETDETINQGLSYEGGSDFTDEDVDQATCPDLLSLNTIKSAEDILVTAHYIQRYANYMTVDYLRTNALLGEYVNEHRVALLYEPGFLLHLVRPQNLLPFKERVDLRVQKALKDSRNAGNRLPVAFYEKDGFTFGHFEDDIDWKDWYPVHKAHIDKILHLTRIIYMKKPDINPFATVESFNATLCDIDPEFKKVL